MAEKITIARPYAKAIFNVALAMHRLSEWNDVLKSLANMAISPLMKHLLQNPRITSFEVVDIFTQIIMHSSSAALLQTEINNMLSLLALTKRLGLLTAMTQHYQEMLSKHEGTINVEVISALPLSDLLKEKIENKLEKKLNAKVAIQ